MSNAPQASVNTLISKEQLLHALRKLTTEAVGFDFGHWCLGDIQELDNVVNFLRHAFHTDGMRKAIEAGSVHHVGWYTSGNLSVQAMQRTSSNWETVFAFVQPSNGFIQHNVRPDGRIELVTERGVGVLNEGDFVIKNRQGRVGICDPETFQFTYHKTDAPIEHCHHCGKRLRFAPNGDWLHDDGRQSCLIPAT